jgi:hypothetical protein
VVYFQYSECKGSHTVIIFHRCGWKECVFDICILVYFWLFYYVHLYLYIYIFYYFIIYLYFTDLGRRSERLFDIFIILFYIYILQIWVEGVCVCLLFFVTLACFPALASSIQSCGEGNWRGIIYSLYNYRVHIFKHRNIVLYPIYLCRSVQWPFPTCPTYTQNLLKEKVLLASLSWDN